MSFAVLAEPHRREILDLLRSGERPVGDLVAELKLSQPDVSKHLRVLRDAGLVDVRPGAQQRLYRLRPEPQAENGAGTDRKSAVSGTGVPGRGDLGGRRRRHK